MTAKMMLYGYKIGDGVMHKRLNKNATIVGFRTSHGAATPKEIENSNSEIWVEVKDMNGDLLGWNFVDLADFPRITPTVKLKLQLKNAHAKKERTAKALQAAWDADNEAANKIAEIEAILRVRESIAK